MADDKDAIIADLQQQLVAMDRILSGRTAVANNLAAESGLLLAPFLHISGLFDAGTPPFVPRGIRFELNTSFHETPISGSRYDTRTHNTNYVRPLSGITAASRLILAIVNPAK